MFSKIKKKLEIQRRVYQKNLFWELVKKKITPDMGQIEREMISLEIRTTMDKSFRKKYQAVKEIHIIAKQNEISKDDVHKIVELFNNANHDPVDSGWNTWFKGAITGLLREKNLRYRTSSMRGNIEIIDDHWKLLNPANLQGVVESPLINEHKLFFNLRNLGWGLDRHVPQLNFELYNQWADLEATGYDEIIIKGVIVEERFEEFAKMWEDMGLRFYLELYKEGQHVKTASNLVGLS